MKNKVRDERLAFYTRLGQNLREARVAAHLTCAEVGEMLDSSSTAVASWERARFFPLPHTVWELSLYYGVSLDELIPKEW